MVAKEDERKLTHFNTSQPPELEILEIGDLSTDRFRGIFRLTYTGDAYIVLQTKVQVCLIATQPKRSSQKVSYCLSISLLFYRPTH